MKRLAAAALAALLTAGLPGAAWAQGAYPTRPARLVVPFPPGGGNDFIARVLSTQLTAGLGQQVLVENRPGANGVIGTDAVAKAAPDGYTMVLGFVAPLAISPSLQPVPYDAAGDFAYLNVVANSYHIFVVNPAVGARSLKELIDLAKKRPGSLNYASGGTGSPLHLVGELFRMVAGVDIVHVPYKGSGPAATAVLAGEAQMIFGSISSSLAHVRAGKLYALGVTSPERSPLAPDVPTLAESGVAGVEVPSWYVLAVPARTPVPVLERLRAEMKRIADSAEAREQLARQAIALKVYGTAEFAAFLKAETARWGQVVKTMGIKAE